MSQLSRRMLQRLFVFSSTLLVLGAACYMHRPVGGGTLVTIGGSGIALFYLAQTGYTHSLRVRRLNRIAFFGSLAYICSGALMFLHRSSWVLLFSVATVLFVYSMLVRSYRVDK